MLRSSPDHHADFTGSIHTRRHDELRTNDLNVGNIIVLPWKICGRAIYSILHLAYQVSSRNRWSDLLGWCKAMVWWSWYRTVAGSPARRTVCVCASAWWTKTRTDRAAGFLGGWWSACPLLSVRKMRRQFNAHLPGTRTYNNNSSAQPTPVVKLKLINRSLHLTKCFRSKLGN